MTVRKWAGVKQNAQTQRKRLGAEGGAVIKNQRNQRKGRLTARKRLRYEVASQSGTCPSLREAQGPEQEKKERLKRQEAGKGTCEHKTQQHTLGKVSPLAPVPNKLRQLPTLGQTRVQQR